MVVGIIGAGIGGLTAAIALQQLGINVKLFERAKHIETVGAGISLAPNAMGIFRLLNLFDEVVAAGVSWEHYIITDENFNILQKIPPTFYRNKETVGISIGRAALHQLLFSKIPSHHIFLDHELVSVESIDEKAILKFKDQSSQTVDILIGADGINSVVRKMIFPESSVVSVHQICWRGLYPTQTQQKNVALEAWGRGNRFGKTKITNKLEYWYVVKDATELPQKWDQSYIVEQIPEFNRSAHEMILNTDSENILLHPIVELKPLKKWYKNNIVLLGDAAHAMTPNMGQGACQAIIDAYTLAAVISKGESFEKYEKSRRPTVNKLVLMSRWVGMVAQWENKFMVKVRNLCLRLSQPLMNLVKM